MIYILIYDLLTNFIVWLMNGVRFNIKVDLVSQFPEFLRFEYLNMYVETVRLFLSLIFMVFMNAAPR